LGGFCDYKSGGISGGKQGAVSVVVWAERKKKKLGRKGAIRGKKGKAKPG